jgi:PIN domain nuclease of toxin-antitoxin system
MGCYSVRIFHFILDAWALLAHFGDEPGAERVRQFLKSAAQGEGSLGMSIVSIGEVAYNTERERGLARVYLVLAAVRSLDISILPVDENVVSTAAHIKANHRLF